jgi:hypothetical protein
MGNTMKIYFRFFEHLLITALLAGCGGAGSGNTNAPPPANTAASTASITSYLSTEYTNEQALVAIDLQSANIGNGASLYAATTSKESRVQTFLTNAITYIQTVKQSNAIDKAAIAILFTNYQGSDLGFLNLQVFSAARAQLDQTYTPAINSYYVLAAAQLNAL